MIIVSQDKDNIINFDNIKSIWIDDNVLDKTDTMFDIYADDEFIAEYSTEERAKEVLQEILKYYDSLKTNTIYAISDKDYPMDMKSYYEMPKE